VKPPSAQGGTNCQVETLAAWDQFNWWKIPLVRSAYGKGKSNLDGKWLCRFRGKGKPTGVFTRDIRTRCSKIPNKFSCHATSLTHSLSTFFLYSSFSYIIMCSIDLIIYFIYYLIKILVKWKMKYRTQTSFRASVWRWIYRYIAHWEKSVWYLWVMITR